CTPRMNALSPDELRKRLYQTFKNRGVLDTLKVRIYMSILPVRLPVLMKSDSVLITTSLVADHLQNSASKNTLSVHPLSGLV
uniref:Uncharacterized protein n=1 Tax=Oncorhynchus tshawytscha TaxID=74940 RepID=A0AAZ3NWU2_ONCTS